MNELNEQREPLRIMQETIPLRKAVNDEIVLGPALDVTLRRYSMAALLLEFALVAAMIFAISVWKTSFTMTLVIGFVFGTLTTLIMAAQVWLAWRETKRQNRFIMTKEFLIVKNDANEEVSIPRTEPVEFVQTQTVDREMQTIYDLSLHHENERYYLLSSRDKETLDRLSETLVGLVTSY